MLYAVRNCDLAAANPFQHTHDFQSRFVKLVATTHDPKRQLPQGILTTTRWRLLCAVVLVVAVAAVSARSEVADGASYGYATTGGNGTYSSNGGGGGGQGEDMATCTVTQVPCPSGDLVPAPLFAPGFNYFTAFRGTVLTPSGAAGYVRFWIPYDALGYCPAGDSCTTNQGECTASPCPSEWRSPAVGPADLQYPGSRGAGANPRCGRQFGERARRRPGFPDPLYGAGSSYVTGTTAAGQDYYCGVWALIFYTRAVLGASAVPQWEAFNEGNAYPAWNGNLNGICNASASPCGGSHPGYLCGSNYINCGPLELAGLWELAQAVVLNNGWSGNQAIGAYSGTDAETSYITGYVGQLNGFHNAASGFPNWWQGRWPGSWSIHDYEDPTNTTGTADLQWFEQQIDLYAGASVWVTEAGVHMQDGTTSDKNGSAPCGATLTFGYCVNATTDPSNAASYQAAGAEVWKALGSVHYLSVGTSEVYWYEFANPNPGATGSKWDSALVSNGGAQPYDTLCALVPTLSGCVANSS